MSSPVERRIRVELTPDEWRHLFGLLESPAATAFFSNHSDVLKRLMERFKKANPIDPVEEASVESFPASDPPGYTPVTNVGSS